jgi:hypothetical protein
MADQVDVEIIDHGTISVVVGKTGIAKSHLEERMPDDVQMWGGGYVVEPRFLDHIVSDLIDQDFTVAMV